MEKPPYEATIRVDFEAWPHLIPQKLDTEPEIDGPLKAIRGASSRRFFTLADDWKVEIGPADGKEDRYEEKLYGTVIIPTSYKEPLSNTPIETRLDGASVPYPWIISFLSFGVLRPLGVMLLASIVHDFAFAHGGLLYKTEEDQNPRFEPIAREVADKLFYDIIVTVNNMEYTASLAWLAVRLGWLWIPYADKSLEWKKPPRKGKCPVIAFVTLSVALLLFGALLTVYGIKTVMLVLVAIYLLIFLLLQFTAPSPKKDA
jgi:hypothetical protein